MSQLLEVGRLDHPARVTDRYRHGTERGKRIRVENFLRRTVLADRAPGGILIELDPGARKMTRNDKSPGPGSIELGEARAVRTKNGRRQERST